MRATTFIERQQVRNRELVALLVGERHLRNAMVQQLARELNMMVALEEELFLPAVAPLAPSAHARVQATVEGVMETLLDVVTCTGDAAFEASLERLSAALAQHANASRELLDAADASLEPARLEDLGAAMSRFESDALSHPERDSGTSVVGVRRGLSLRTNALVA